MELNCMPSGRGHSREYFQLAVAGGAPLEIAQRCRVHVDVVRSWMSRNRAEVEEARQIYRDRLIDGLVMMRLQRAEQELSGLHVTDQVNSAATPPPPHIQTLKHKPTNKP
jgi:hypothetical protein